jgi:hypothetical protein
VESGSVTIPMYNEFFFRLGATYESRAKPRRMHSFLNFKPINPCTRGKLVFLYFKLSKHLKWIGTVPYGLTSSDQDPGQNPNHSNITKF